MRVIRDRLAFLSGRRMRVVSAVLLLHAMLLYGVSRKEALPQVAPLSEFPPEIGRWTLASELRMDEPMFERVKPDDYAIRSYADAAGGTPMSVYIAYFRTQRTGHLPHSPKNCLPGNGWVPASATVAGMAVDGGKRRIEVNRTIVQKGENRALVLYWYQSWNRVEASEYAARAHLLVDAIRYNRTDTALVRVSVPLNGDEASAGGAAMEFSQSLYGLLQRWIGGA